MPIISIKINLSSIEVRFVLYQSSNVLCLLFTRRSMCEEGVEYTRSNKSKSATKNTQAKGESKKLRIIFWLYNCINVSVYIASLQSNIKIPELSIEFVFQIHVDWCVRTHKLIAIYNFRSAFLQHQYESISYSSGWGGVSVGN